MKIYSLAFSILFQFPFACDETLEFVTSSPVVDSQQKLNGNKPGVANIVFKSTDGGLTWKDISEGLPEIVGPKDDGIHVDDFFADDRGLYLSAGNWIYHNKPNSTASFWSKEILPDDHRSIAPAGKTGIFAYNYANKEFLRNTTGTSTWTSTYENFKPTRPQTFFETAGGTVFVGTDRRLYRSTDSGKSWKQVSPVGWVLKLVESNGVLMAATTKGIIRSTDDGQTWELVTNEEGVGIAVEKGFAAINTGTRVRTSYDDGKTWNPVAGLPGNTRISSIVQVGEYLLCSHPKGIYRSSDKGKKWTLLFPSVDNKVFNICVSGNVIYAIPRSGGC